MRSHEKTVNKKGSKRFKFLFIIALGVEVFLLSEFLYLINQRAHIYALYHVALAQKLADNLGPQGSFNLLAKAARINIRKVAKTYREFMPSDYSPEIDISSSSEEFKTAFNLYLEGLDLKKLGDSSEGDMARIFYNLGLLANKNGDFDLVPMFFQTSVYLNPELSHFHLELANFYLKNGDEKKTKSALEFCSKFDFPRNHCQQYIDNNLYWKVPEQVGFLKGAIEKHYSEN